MIRIQKSLPLNFSAGNGFIAESTYQVPAGNRLVIEWISASQFVPQGAGGSFGITTQVVGEQAFHALATFASATTDGNVNFTASQVTRIYADPDSVVRVNGTRSVKQGSQYGDFVFSGYLENA
jgi:hypothetical protein